jgi:AraC family ethanolamine operon transcriptional activator
MAFVVVQDIDDPCVWEAASPPWEVLASPIGCDPFRNIKRTLVTPNWLIYRESFGSALRVQGWTPAGMLGFTVPIRLGSRSSYWRAALHEHGLPAALPGSLDVVLDAGQEQMVALTRLDWFRAQLDPVAARTIEGAAAGRVLPASARQRGALGIWLRCLVDRVHSEPRILDYPAVVTALEQDLLDRLLRTLCLGGRGTTLEGPLRRQRGFDLAIETIRSADLDDLNLADLCGQVGVSQRTLEYAFRERLGASPAEFIRRLRLHRARRALLAAQRGDDTVAVIAMTFGFYQLGRFAAEYRTIFGELPSATLARRCTYAGASLLG